MTGAQPDGVFYIRNAPRIIGKRKLDLNIDPPPDIVVEIDITNQSRGKFPLYAKLGIPEIWRYDGRSFEIYHLEDDKYERQSNSLSFPTLADEIMGRHLELSKSVGQDEALEQFRIWAQQVHM